ncbi:hypothetical protein ACMC56_07880 [Campylobacterota bacterium DY0563]
MQYKKISLSILLLLLPLIAEAKKLEIIDYKPSKYTEFADEPFFYSIGRTLRYGKTISEKDPILFKGDFFGGKLQAVYPSPDNKKAVVLTKKKLYLVTLTKPPKLILNNVDSYGASSVNIGEYFFLGASLRWNKTSDYMYIVSYRKRKGTWKTSTGRDSMLLRVNINKPTVVEIVINNFSSDYKYYFVGRDTICFNYAPGNGDLIWKCMYQGKRIKVKSQTKDVVVLENGTVLDGKPFVTSYGNGEIRLTDNGYFLKNIEKGISGFFSKAYGETPIFKIRTSHNFKGNFIDGVMEHQSNVLPGGRYALLYVLHKNFTGQLLVDGLTGKYKELPSKTKVYMTLNSFNYKNFHFKPDEINNPEFIQANKLRRMTKD